MLADVPALEGGQAEGAVLVGVHVVADPEVAEVEQPDRGGAGPLQRHPLQPEVDQHPLAGLGQRLAEQQHPVELLRVPALAPLRVVEVLAAPGVVGADGLQVAVGVRRDPHVAPRRRDDQVADPLGVLVGQLRALLVEVGEALARAATGPARLVGRGAAKSGHGGTVARRLRTHSTVEMRSSHSASRPRSAVAQPARVRRAPRAARSPRPTGPGTCGGRGVGGDRRDGGLARQRGDRGVPRDRAEDGERGARRRSRGSAAPPAPPVRRAGRPRRSARPARAGGRCRPSAAGGSPSARGSTMRT